MKPFVILYICGKKLWQLQLNKGFIELITAKVNFIRNFKKSHFITKNI